MNRRHPSHQRRNGPKRTSSRQEVAPAPKPERKPIVVYGQPFIVLEDESKNTFTYQSGNWIPHSMTIAECRASCQVRELPQKLNRMIRYEVRSPVNA